ncbi:hypothetical protein CVT25_008478 [Psilocybe cyanescens]|uniref:Uncharacterized protein n=1 Tax=Psilocybe cyanescens TaxID=93625 RepID=A0A409XRZ8_PSICY|nr:hypothetical protein CVT25_008478 [Psilocybe cyanescens]
MDSATGSALSRRRDAKRKLVGVGDGGCGKTCLLIVYAENRFPEVRTLHQIIFLIVDVDVENDISCIQPTAFENYVTLVQHENRLIEVGLWDTAGQEDYDRLRPLSYPESDVILIVFSVDFPTSLANVLDKPEASHFCPSTPILLIGIKTDLRADPTTVRMLSAQGQVPDTPEQGRSSTRTSAQRTKSAARRQARASGRCSTPPSERQSGRPLGQDHQAAKWWKEGSRTLKAICTYLPTLFSEQFIKDGEWEREWSDVMAYTKSGDPFVGPVRQVQVATNDDEDHSENQYDGQYISAGYSGHGVPRAYACAEAEAGMIAAQIQGKDWKAPAWLPEQYLKWATKS